MIVSSLSSEHNSESVEVSGVGSKCVSGESLSSWSLGPVGFEVFIVSSLDDGGSSGTLGDSEGDSSEGQSLKWIKNSWEFTNTVNEDSVTVSHIGDNNDLTVVWSIIDVTNSTWLNNVSKTLYIQLN